MQFVPERMTCCRAGPVDQVLECGDGLGDPRRIDDRSKIISIDHRLIEASLENLVGLVSTNHPHQPLIQIV